MRRLGIRVKGSLTAPSFSTFSSHATREGSTASMERKPLSQSSCVLTPAPAPRSNALAHAPPLGRTCTVKGGEIGSFGGGWLEHSRQWLGAQRAGLFLGVPSCPEPPGVP